MNSLTVNTDNSKYLYFLLGEKKYAVELTDVIEVMKLPLLDYPQKLPNNILGLLKFNNIMINVIDLRFYLNMEVTSYSESNKLLVVKTDETIFAIITDSIQNIIEIDNSKVKRLPLKMEYKIIESVYEDEDESIAILNLYSIENLLKTRNNLSDYSVENLFPKDVKSLNKLIERRNNLLQKNETNYLNNFYSRNKFISFSLDETIFCIALTEIKEVTNKAILTPIPSNLPYIEGLLTIRGEFITILNMKSFFDYENINYTSKNNVIVLNAGDYKIGFLVDEIKEIVEIAEEQTIHTKSSNETPYILSEVFIENKVYNVMNIPVILSDNRFLA